MQISSLTSGGGQSLLLQRLMGATGADGASSANSANSANSAASTGPGGAAPPGPPPGMGPRRSSDSFGSDTLSALTSTQTAGGFDPAQVSGELADSLIGAFGSNGGLSLSQVETALGVTDDESAATTTASTSAADLSSAFASLDTDGDGELSTSELASGVDTMFKSMGPPPGPPPGPPAQGDAAAGEDGGGSSALASGDATDVGGDLTAQMLKGLLAQFAQAQYANAGAWATQATSQAGVSV